MTWREWLGLVAGMLAFVALFLPWTVLTTTNPRLGAVLADLPPADVVRDAFGSGFFAWFPPLVLLLAGLTVVLFGQVRAVRVSGLPQLWLVAATVVLALLVMGWFTLGWQFGEQQRALLDDVGVTINGGIGRALATTAAAVSALVAVLDLRVGRPGGASTQSRRGPKVQPRGRPDG